MEEQHLKVYNPASQSVERMPLSTYVESTRVDTNLTLTLPPVLNESGRALYHPKQNVHTAADRCLTLLTGLATKDTQYGYLTGIKQAKLFAG